jgi:hypothetical protein
MYTVLGHVEILQTLRWIKRQGSRLRRTDKVAVQLRGGRGVHWGPALNEDSDDWTTITLQQMYWILAGEIRCVFTRGTTLLKQIKGIAMGKPSSPPVAIGLCARRELDYNKNQRPHLTPLAISWSCDRYMDDLSNRIGI